MISGCWVFYFGTSSAIREQLTDVIILDRRCKIMKPRTDPPSELLMICVGAVWSPTNNYHSICNYKFSLLVNEYIAVVIFMLI